MFELINNDESFLSKLNFEKIEQLTKFVKKIQVTIISNKIVVIERKTNTNANYHIAQKTNTVENHKTRFKKIIITIISNKIVVIKRKTNTNENHKTRFKKRRFSIISISDIQN